MDHPRLCRQCSTLSTNDHPHQSLSEISKLPGVSTLYLCRDCRSLWLCDVESGWQLTQQRNSAELV